MKEMDLTDKVATYIGDITKLEVTQDLSPYIEWKILTSQVMK